jgi:hypothetical protein
VLRRDNSYGVCDKKSIFRVPMKKTMLDEIQTITGTSRPQAERTVQVVLAFLGTRLPSPIMGRIREALSEDEARGSAWQTRRPTPD